MLGATGRAPGAGGQSVLLDHRLRTERTPDDRIPDWLAAQGSEFTDPYTGRPMEWDPDTRRLSFKGLGAKPTYREVFLAPEVSRNE